MLSKGCPPCRRKERNEWSEEDEMTTDWGEVMYGIKEIQFVVHTVWLCERHSWTLLVSAASNRAVVFPDWPLKRIICTLMERTVGFFVSPHSHCSDLFEMSAGNHRRGSANKTHQQQTTWHSNRSSPSCQSALCVYLLQKDVFDLDLFESVWKSVHFKCYKKIEKRDTVKENNIVHVALWRKLSRCVLCGVQLEKKLIYFCNVTIDYVISSAPLS